MTVAEARAAVARSPEFWKIALVEGSSFPLLEAEDADVRLFELKKDAQDALKAREKELVDDGYRRTLGARSRGFLKLQKGDSMVALGLDYPKRIDGGPPVYLGRLHV